MTDLTFQNEGTITIMRANTPAGEAWIDEHIPDDAMTFGNGIVIEHRYVLDIMEGALSDGLDIGRV